MPAAHAWVEVEYRIGREPEQLRCKDASELKSIVNNRESNPDVTEIRVYPRQRTIGFTRERSEEYHDLERPPSVSETPAL